MFNSFSYIRMDSIKKTSQLLTEAKRSHIVKLISLLIQKYVK